MRYGRFLAIAVLTTTAIFCILQSKRHSDAARIFEDNARREERAGRNPGESPETYKRRVSGMREIAQDHHYWSESVYFPAAALTAPATLFLVILPWLPAYRIPRERRLQWLLSMGFLLVGGILTLFCSDLPARTGTITPKLLRMTSSSSGSKSEEVTGPVRPDTVRVGEVALGKELWIILASLAVALFALLLPMGRWPVWHFLRSAAIAAAALLIVVSALNVFVATPPYSENYETNYHIAYGCWVNLLAALMVGAGAALRVPLDWSRTAAAPAVA